MNQNMMPNALEETVSSFKSEETENVRNKSEDNADSDYVPESDGSRSDCESDDTVDSKDYDKLDKHWQLAARTQLGDLLWGENVFTKNLSETAEVPTSNVNKHFRDFCLFCSRPVFQQARHLAQFQSDDVEVEVTFQCPLHLRDRPEIWKNNETVLKTGKEELAVRTRPSKPAKSPELIQCVNCHGLFKKECFFNHLKNCSKKEEEVEKRQVKRKPVVPLCEHLIENCKELSVEFKKVLYKLERDEVTEAVMGNRIILQFGEHMLRESGQNVNKHEHIRQTLRDVARLVLEAQRSTPMKSLEDFFNPSNFLHVLSAVRFVAGFDPRKKTYTFPLLAHDLGHHLQTICSIVVRNAAKSCDTQVIESCKNFLTLYCKKWNRVIGQRFKENVAKSTKYEGVAGGVKRPRHATESENKLMTGDDTDMESGVRVQRSLEEKVSTEHHIWVFSSRFRSSNPSPQQNHEPTNTSNK